MGVHHDRQRPAERLIGGRPTVRPRAPDRGAGRSSAGSGQVIPRADRHTVEDVLEAAGVDPARGLTPGEARARAELAGPNALPEPRRAGLGEQVLTQLREPMAVLLLVAAAVSGVVLGEVVDGVAIAVIVVVNAAIAVVEERRADAALTALRALTVPETRVRRDGAVLRIPAPELVPGDVVLLEPGDRVPADLRLVATAGVEIDESVLTGESQAVRKDASAVSADDAGLADRPGAAFTGTFVERGTATGIAVATGASTTLAAIAREATATRRLTPLQTDLVHVTRQLATVSIAVAGGVLLLFLARSGVGEDTLQEGFLAAVALAVAAVPEGLATVTAVGLALGVRRMAERGTVVRRLAAVETLGSVTVLLLDKTGTLTQNQMGVAGVYDTAGGSATARQAARGAVRVMALCNDATLDPPVGDPMEVALLDAVGDDELRDLRARWTRVATSPFDADRRWMATVHVPEDGSSPPELLVKGAPESVLPHCARDADGSPLDNARRAVLDARVHDLADTGVRLLALARRPLVTVPDDLDGALEDLELVGLVGLHDPVREAAAASVATARRAGITLLMATGDHPGTARAVAAAVGMADARNARVITGHRLRVDGIADDPASSDVYARVDPDQKLALVEQLQRRGEVVGMTGDGVNDAPALRRADIGIALGRRGSDVAREAADMVITDDDLATIVAAVAEGRRIYDNLRKVVDYLVAGNLGEIFVVMGGLLFVPALGLPLLPLQLLWINLVTDGLPAVALGVDAADRTVMQRPPRAPGTRLLSWARVRRLALRALVIAASVLAALAVARLALDLSWDQARTVMFGALVFAHLGYAYVVRRGSGGPGGNPWLLIATAGGIALQVLLVLLPATRALFDVTALTAAGWFTVLVAGVVPNVVLWAVEARRS
ncbi:MAG TPA: cation-transporting P-type ATPase [Euzebyales bacterium]